MDVVDQNTRSRMMGGIRGKNTRPERAVRSCLHRAGFRFGLHSRRLKGKPDIVLPKWNVVVFVHGCFWHRHAGCSNATMPAIRRDFWQTKFRQNVERDKRNIATLSERGWRVFIVWECGVRHELDQVMDLLVKALRDEKVRFLELPESLPRKMTDKK